jgi:hypothetical protein
MSRRGIAACRQAQEESGGDNGTRQSFQGLSHRVGLPSFSPGIRFGLPPLGSSHSCLPSGKLNGTTRPKSVVTDHLDDADEPLKGKPSKSRWRLHSNRVANASSCPMVFGDQTHRYSQMNAPLSISRRQQPS